MLPIWIDFSLTTVQIYLQLLIGLALFNLKPKYGSNIPISILAALVNVFVFHNVQSFIIRTFAMFIIIIVFVTIFYQCNPKLSFIFYTAGFLYFFTIDLIMLFFISFFPIMELSSYFFDLKMNLIIFSLEVIITIIFRRVLIKKRLMISDFSELVDERRLTNE